MSSNYSVVKACINENMNRTVYCCNKISGLDADCCNDAVSGLERWDFGSKDVHGTAFILKDGSFSRVPDETQSSKGQYWWFVHSMVDILRLRGYRCYFQHPHTCRI